MIFLSSFSQQSFLVKNQLQLCYVHIAFFSLQIRISFSLSNYREYPRFGVFRRWSLRLYKSSFPAFFLYTDLFQLDSTSDFYSSQIFLQNFLSCRLSFIPYHLLTFLNIKQLKNDFDKNKILTF